MGVLLALSDSRSAIVLLRGGEGSEVKAFAATVEATVEADEEATASAPAGHQLERSREWLNSRA